MPTVLLPGKGTVEIPAAGRRSVRADEILNRLPGEYSLVRRGTDGQLAVVQANEEIAAEAVVQALPVSRAGADK